MKGEEVKENGVTLRTFVATAFIFSLLGFLLIQGPEVNLRTLFVPYHPDDFSALSGGPGFHFGAPRPVSTSITYFLGSFGAVVYYTSFVAIWMLGFVATQFTVVRIFRPETPMRLSRWALLSFSMPAVWFTLEPAATTVQYLMSNALSYLLAMIAACLAISRPLNFDQPIKRDFRHLAFCLFVLLSAFAKEDMIFFLLSIALWRGYLASTARAGPKRIMSEIFFTAVPVACAYALSFAHSAVVGSPFIGPHAGGPYALNTPLSNVLRNARLYFNDSPGTIVVACLALVFFLGSLAAVYSGDEHRPKAAASLFLLLATLALASPYLLLPRFFSFYMANFIPFLLTSILVVGFTFFETRPSPQIWLGPSLLALVMLTGFYFIDSSARKIPIRWVGIMRGNSRKQMQETRQALGMGMTECGTVVVSGVSNTLGPFLDQSSRFLSKSTNTDLRWIILAERHTVMGDLAPRTSTDKKWRYLLAGSNEAKALELAPNCKLNFDKSTLNASWVPAPGRGRNTTFRRR